MELSLGLTGPVELWSQFYELNTQITKVHHVLPAISAISVSVALSRWVAMAVFSLCMITPQRLPSPECLCAWEELRYSKRAESPQITPSAPPPLNYSGFLIIPQPCRYSVERNFIPLWQSRRETVCATVCNTRVARFQGVCVCVWGRFYNSSFVGEGRSDFVAVLFFILPSREWSRKASDRAHLVVFPLVP